MHPPDHTPQTPPHPHPNALPSPLAELVHCHHHGVITLALQRALHLQQRRRGQLAAAYPQGDGVHQGAALGEAQPVGAFCGVGGLGGRWGFIGGGGGWVCT